MKKLTKILALIVALSMLLSVSVYASGEPSGEASSEPAAAAVTAPGPVTAAPLTAKTTDVNSLPPSQYATITNYTARDDTGKIIIGKEVKGPEAVALNETVTGPAYTSVYASGEMAAADVSGTLVLTDDTDGQLASDFNGQGSAFVAYGDADMTIHDANVYTKGFERTGVIVSEKSNVMVKDSSFTVLGADPLTEAWDGYVNSANQNIMLSPPWVLGIMGGARVVNMIGATPTLSVVNSQMTAGGWAVLSTDSGQNMVINAVDSDLTILPAADENGMDSGWRIFGYDPNAYGSGYGSYYIGNPSQYYYGVNFDGVTYAGIITGATTGHYASSNGPIDLYDAEGNYIETVQGQGRPTTINGVFGIMMHNSLSDGLYIEDGTVVNTEDAIVIYKAANGDFYFDNAELNSKNGVLFQMIDNDDDSRVGMISMAEGFATTYDDEKLNEVSGEIVASTDVGFPGINYSYDYKDTLVGNDVTATYTNGYYEGNIYNGTGYYSQAGDNLTVNVGQGAALIGDIALTSTIKGLPYSPEAIEGIAYYGDDIQYVLLDAQGQPVTGNDGSAAYIQITGYTMNEYFLQGHVQNIPYYNGHSSLAVNVDAGASWVVTGTSLITSLNIAQGGAVAGAITVNPDGTLTLTPSDNVIPAGSYGGTVTVVGGGQSVGGGVTADGTLDVEAAANALVTGGTAAGSSEPTAQAPADASSEPAAQAPAAASTEPAAQAPAAGSSEPAAAAVTAPGPVTAGGPLTATTKDASTVPASSYATITNYTARDDTGKIIIGKEVKGPEAVVLNETVTGPAYTSVYASGEMAAADVSGTLVLTDDTDGQLASDFNGQGSAFVAYGDADMTIHDANVYTKGFERTGVIVSEKSNVMVKDSSFTILGADPLTEAWDGYVNSANQNIMLSPPWVLGIMGGARVVNMIGATPTLSVVNSQMTAGGWAVLSTDSGQNMVINAVDSDLAILPAADENGMDSGWRIFGYDPNAYGSGYGSYYIGNPSQYYYGVNFDGVTYAGIITGAKTGHYASSNGPIDLYDAEGNYIETVQGQGRPTTINGVFGIMMHNSLSDGLYIEDGTVVNTEDAIVIYKAANGDFYFDNAELNSKNGVLFQMIDNDDDSRVGMISMAEGFSTTYEDEKLNTVSGEPAMNAGIGFPGINYAYTSKTGGNDVTATYTNGFYQGNIYNGTGYYNQAGDNLTVTVGAGGTLMGGIALTSTVKSVPYSAEAIEGIAYYGDDIQYVLLDAQGNQTLDPNAAAYIQFTGYTMNEYFLQGHVQNKNHYNGASTLAVEVKDGGTWIVSEESLITSLNIAEGSSVIGAITVNADGTLTLTPAGSIIPAGFYGGTAVAVGGGQNVGGGVTDDGTLDVEAAANALIGGGQAASGEPAAQAPAAASSEPAAQAPAAASSEPAAQAPAASSEPAVQAPASGEPAPTASTVAPSIIIANSLSAEPSGEASGGPSTKETTIVINGQEYVIDVYFIDGEEYVKLVDLAALFGTDSATVTWAAYQDYLYNAAVGNAPNAQEFHDQIYGLASWDDMDLTVSPWDQLFTTVGLTTWPEFVMNGGAGASSQVQGAMG